MSITISVCFYRLERALFSLSKGHIFRFHDRGSWYRRTDIDKSGFTRFSGRNCSFWSLDEEMSRMKRDESNEHRCGGKKGHSGQFSSVLYSESMDEAALDA